MPGRITKDRVGEKEPEGWRAWPRLLRSIPSWLGLLLLGLIVAVLINPTATGPALPVSDEDVGKVATRDIEAPATFPIPDVESTERKRKEAEDAVLLVYDFNQELGEDAIHRLKSAFAEMAAVVQEVEGHPGSPDKAEAAGEETEAEGGAGALKKRAAPVRKPPPRKAPERPLGPNEVAPAPSPDSLDGRLNALKDRFIRNLQVVVGEEDFARLKGERFSPETLSALAGLVERTMRHMIVPSKELLGAERFRGITVRFIVDGVAQQEQVMKSFAKILDLDEAILRLEKIAETDLGEVPAGLRATEIRIARGLIRPNLALNSEETNRRKKDSRELVPPLQTTIKKNTVLIRRGDPIEQKHIRIFREMEKLSEVSNAGEMFFGTVLLVMSILIITLRFSTRNIRAFKTRPRDLMLLGITLLVFVVTTKVWYWIFEAIWERSRVFPLESFCYAIPFAAGAMLIRFVLNSEMALAFSAVASLLTGLLMENSIGYAIYCLTSSLMAAWAVASAKQRASLVKAGALVGLANMGVAVGLSLFSGMFLSFETLFNAIFAFSGGILSAMIVTGTAPIIEMLLGYTTDIKLLELANLNHPLLKDLIVQAPGSYHHSIIVGSLVEAAAETIRCNPLLARVLAYYHDIGKVKSPNYFSENQRDLNNPHDKLKPSLSATVLKAHVKDGAELARVANLGQPIVDAIVQHHGTSLIKFFFQKAKEQEDPENPVAEEEFRYLGPKPQSREVALVMLADSVEAAAKSISDPSPARLQGLVQNMINRIFADGQLDECDLTLKDLHEIARAFNRVLTGIYHRRPDYPESAVKERENTKTKIDELKKEPEKRRENGEKQEDLKRLGM